MYEMTVTCHNCILVTYRRLVEYLQNSLFERLCLSAQRIVVGAWINDEIFKLEIEKMSERMTAR